MMLSFLWLTIILFSIGRGEDVSSMAAEQKENESSMIEALMDTPVATQNKPSAIATLVDSITDIVKKDITASVRKEYQQALAHATSMLTSRLDELQRQIDQIPKEPQWPKGSYCILANGECPAGFQKFSGYMKAVKQYEATGAYIQPVTFGSSRIQCHLHGCGKHGQWIGDLVLTSCCK